MPESTRESFILQLPLKDGYDSVLVGALEKAGSLFGLNAAKTRTLCETAARVCSYLCRRTASREVLVVEILPGGSIVEVAFTFSADPADLSDFDLAMPESVEQKDSSGSGEASFGGIDVFRISRSGGLEVKIVLGQEKEYPYVSCPKGAPLPALSSPHEIADDPSADEIMEACLAAQSVYPHHLLHKCVFQPSKMVNMAACGEMPLCLALDRNRRPSALICWQPSGHRHALFFGPYLFAREPGAVNTSLAWLITESFLCRASRSGLAGVFSGLCTPELPVEGFEALGTVPYSLGSGSCLPITTYYRHLREDQGGVVWAHPVIEQYLRAVYERFSFIREICTTSVRTSPTSPRTVIFAEIRRELAEAILRPLAVGPDVRSSLDRHIGSLKERGMRNIFFHVDLAFAWQVRLAPELLENGFLPAFLLPCAGTSDLLIFHHDKSSDS